MGSPHKNIQLMLEFLEALFLVLHFSYYTLMAFLILYMILLSMLMILLSILSVIRHMICGDNYNWVLNLNLTCVCTGALSGLLISMLEKLNWFHSTDVITLVILIVCSYHVTYVFQSGFTLYSCVDVKELFARNRCEIWSLSDCNWSRICNHLVCKRTLNHLAKLA